MKRLILALILTSAAVCGQAVPFDYYLFSLSWSPQFCSNHNDPGQCEGNRRYTFVVHGLWPQFERSWPQSCQPSSPVPQDIVQAIMPIMPSPVLIQHEWDTHGTCSGLDPKSYFNVIRSAYDSIRVPKDYAQPLRQVVQTPSQILDHFEAANPTFTRDSFRLGCSGRYFGEVRICMTKDLKARACGSDVRDTCRAPQLILRAVR